MQTPVSEISLTGGRVTTSYTDGTRRCRAHLARSKPTGGHALSVPWVLFVLFVFFVTIASATNSTAPRNDQVPTIQTAYIGPGAGIALVGSFMAVLVALFSAFLAVLTWPMRWIWRAWRNRRALAKAKVGRVVILGLDGLDPDLVDELLAEGRLPNLARLRDQGSYTRLGTTWPPLSPVAWSSFTTGTNPGKHNIFDFISRNKANYGPMMSSVQIGRPGRTLKLGRFLIPLSSAPITGLRKSKPFWTVLGEAGIFSAVLRVPITFPPDRFRGVQLSAMCVPDLRGTQGTFCYFTESESSGAAETVGEVGDAGGERVVVRRNGSAVTGSLPGPVNPLRTDAVETKLPFKVVAGPGDSAVLQIGGEKIKLAPNCYTDWVSVPFPLAPGIKVRGVCRFMLKQFATPFAMYCTPINIDPDKPVMPISHPKVFSIYLAKLFGKFATLGLAEDTWSLSEGVNTEDAFLKQAYDIHAERERMFFDSLRRVRRGMVTCVFDGPDRIQHMFWRFHEADHPALGANGKKINRETHRQTIREMYQKMDDLVGRTIEEVGPHDALFVMSDHGFKSFRRGVDLNAWLRDNGYLKLKDGAQTSDTVYLADVDWSGTRAFAIGLAGIFVNQQGREAQGIVADGEEKRQLLGELSTKLSGLRDEAKGEEAIHEAVCSTDIYSGPYVDSAPDLIVGYNVGYRVSWDAAVGKCGPHAFSDNTKAWSGDHCIHPRLVPGILFSNLQLRDGPASIVDMAPTTLDLLGVDKPSYMDGKSLLG
jgi:predicted AlkP superfamily phosphohydrolase/phosphomutase